MHLEGGRWNEEAFQTPPSLLWDRPPLPCAQFSRKFQAEIKKKKRNFVTSPLLATIQSSLALASDGKVCGAWAKKSRKFSRFVSHFPPGERCKKGQKFDPINDFRGGLKFYVWILSPELWYHLFSDWTWLLGDYSDSDHQMVLTVSLLNQIHFKIFSKSIFLYQFYELNFSSLQICEINDINRTTNSLKKIYTNYVNHIKQSHALLPLHH